MLRGVAGRPVSRARKAEVAQQILARASEAERRSEIAQLTPEGFTGHKPPMPPPLDKLPEAEILQTLDPEERELLLHELWPLAVASIEDVLRDPDASAAAKVSAAKLIGDMKKAQLAEESSKMPTRIIFQTAAFTGVDDA